MKVQSERIPARRDPEVSGLRCAQLPALSSGRMVEIAARPTAARNDREYKVQRQGAGCSVQEKRCEDCEHSVPAGRASEPILICRHKVSAELPWQVVEAEESCANFEQSREIVPLDIAGALAEGAKLIPLSQGKFAVVDAEDYERLSKYKWHVTKGDSTYYARRYTNGKKIRMHRMILDAPEDLLVDHRDHNGLNNRRSNLRLCTHAENSRNTRPARGKSSRYKGVSWDKNRSRYQANIRYNGKLIRIGRFKSEIAAAKAYDEKARKLFGQFAYLNFPAEATEKH